MRILLMVIGLSLTIGGGAYAHRATVAIKNAEKVTIKTGISQKKVMGMIYCLNNLKKHDTEDKALEAAMARVKERCASMNIADHKCQKKQRKIARHIHHCYAKAEFLRDYIKPAPTN